jgi:alginate O-acetyltransferase complex protein AlgI
VWELLSKDWRDAWVRRLNIDRSSFAHKTFQVVLTFSLVSFSWLFFRAESVSDALYMVKTIFTLDGTTAISAWVFNDGSLGLDAMDFSLMANALLLFLVFEFVNRRINVFKRLRSQPLWFRWAFYMCLIFAILIFGYYGKFNPEDFVYTRF